MISTRLHVLDELTGGGDSVVAAMRAAPHYVIDPDLIGTLVREDMQASIRAMIEAGVARLPFPALLVEFQLASFPIRRFVLLSETETGFLARSALIVRDELGAIARDAVSVAVTDKGLEVGRAASDSDAQAIALAACFALLMLHIKGVEKEIVDRPKLNLAREKAGKARIPAFTLVRIGTVFNREGQTVHGAGRTMPVHLRAGHVRMQACGEGKADRRAIFIPPVLVNYRGEGAAPRLPQKVVAL